MSLSQIDSLLLEHCLASAPRAWRDFVDRFLGLVVHVAVHTARARGITLSEHQRDDLVSEVFTTIVANDYAVLRRFQRNCSLATYLSVIARRVVVRRLMADRPAAASADQLDHHGQHDAELSRIDDSDQVHQLLTRLDPQEARVVRMYHLEGLSYRQISQQMGINENSIGPVLTRARAKLREEAS